MTRFQWFCLALPAGTLAAICAHYLLFGPRHPECANEAGEVPRFRFWERIAHGMTLLGFLVLAGTGIPAALAGRRLTGTPLLLHWVAAPLFAVGVCAVVLLWHRSAAFEPFDAAWFRVMGGYLSKKEFPVPAARFNAGQKAFFWLAGVVCLVLIITGTLRMYPLFGDREQTLTLILHRWSALLLLCMILVHAYLGTFANPGTVQAMVTGRVSRAWAIAHHPVWARRLGIDEEASVPDRHGRESGENGKKDKEGGRPASGKG